MGSPLAQPTSVIDIGALEIELNHGQAFTLIKTDSLEVLRWVLPAGKDIGRHELVGEITLHCLEGNIVLCTGDSECELIAGDLIHLSDSDNPWLRAIDNSILLLTVLLRQNTS